MNRQNSTVDGNETMKQDGAYASSSLKTNSLAEWLTTEQAADYLKLSVGTLRNLTSDGKIPHYKLGRRNRYSVNDLRALLLQNKRGPQYEY